MDEFGGIAVACNVGRILLANKSPIDGVGAVAGAAGLGLPTCELRLPTCEFKLSSAAPELLRWRTVGGCCRTGDCGNVL